MQHSYFQFGRPRHPLSGCDTHFRFDRRPWRAMIDCWFAMYTGYPDKIRANEGSIFTSPRCKKLTKMAGIESQLSGIEAHNSLDIGERYHEPLKRIYRKVKHDHPNLSPQFLLRISFKGMNDTMSEKGLVPSRFVFGISPRFPILNTQSCCYLISRREWKR